MEKKNFKFIFNDRMFDDGWAEPYIVEVTTRKPISKENLQIEIQAAIEEMQNDEDGMECSESGIKQIFSYIDDLILEIKISQLEYNFEFGR